MQVKPPRVKESAIHFECKLVNTYDVRNKYASSLAYCTSSRITACDSVILLICSEQSWMLKTTQRRKFKGMGIIHSSRLFIECCAIGSNR